jgi:radical SAM superfamily enzyme YgiQ (UPF0313 family)
VYGSSIIQNGGRDLSIVKRLYEEIEKSRPDIVGFSIKAQLGVLSDPLFRVTARLVKERLDVPVVVGGQFTSGQPIETLHTSLTLSMKDIDYLVRGNADLSLPSLIDSIDRGEVPRNVPNVSYREDGKIVDNPVELIKDLDSLPIPDFSQFDLDAYAPVRILPMLTARGCPAHTFISEAVRARVAELPGVKSANVQVVWDPPWDPSRMSDAAKKQLGLT